MSDVARIARDVPALLVNRPVPFVTGVVIRDAVLVPRDGDLVVVRVSYDGGDRSSGTFDFELDDSWGFESAQDAVDQLYVDLVEQLDTGR